MREIKFRAWDIDEKHLVAFGDPDFYYLARHYDGNVEPIGCHNGGGDPDTHIENFELMQYTGLKDKNGVEIYEGDIVSHFGDTSIIVFKDGCFQGKHYKAEAYTGLLGSTEKHFEVIGNIYENPELLK